MLILNLDENWIIYNRNYHVKWNGEIYLFKNYNEVMECTNIDFPFFQRISLKTHPFIKFYESLKEDKIIAMHFFKGRIQIKRNKFNVKNYTLGNLYNDWDSKIIFIYLK